MFFLERNAREIQSASEVLRLDIERILALQKIYRRMLTFMITPMANIMEASAEPP